MVEEPLFLCQLAEQDTVKKPEARQALALAKEVAQAKERTQGPKMAAIFETKMAFNCAGSGIGICRAARRSAQQNVPTSASDAVAHIARSFAGCDSTLLGKTVDLVGQPMSRFPP